MSNDSSSMELIYHPGSPFSRKVYMTAHELGLTSAVTLHRVVVAPIPYKGRSDDNPVVIPLNPRGEIPVLVRRTQSGEEVGLFGSRIICEFLDEELGGGKLRKEAERRDEDKWRLRTIQEATDGMLDAEVHERAMRTEKGLAWEEWVKGMREKVMRGFDFVEREVEKGARELCGDGEVPTMAEIAVASVVAWLDVRGLEWTEGRPELTEWFKRWKKRECMRKTGLDVDWETGEKNELGFRPF